MASYRLSENNARYGTTTFVLAPHKVLHLDLQGREIAKIKEAIASMDPPKVIVVPCEDLSASDAIKILKEAGLWIE